MSISTEAFIERVAEAPDSPDRIAPAISREGLSQAANMNVNRSVIYIYSVAPNLIEKLRAAKHAPWRLHQILKKAEARRPSRTS